MVGTSTLPDGYPRLLARLKREIGAARTRAALAVNEELIGLYWRIGSEILERQQQEGWGGRVTERLATDLRAEFPEMKGFSYTNLKYMRQFAAYVVLELKLGKFRPEYAGQINFYVNVVDGQMRRDHHNATIGLVLCASRNETVARYALNGIDRP